MKKSAKTITKIALLVVAFAFTFGATANQAFATSTNATKTFAKCGADKTAAKTTAKKDAKAAKKCGEGKCGADKKAAKGASKAAKKCGEGKCGL